MQCDQGRRAGRVHRHRRALESEGVRDPARQHAGGTARGSVTGDRLARAAHEVGVVLTVRTGEHSGRAADQRGRIDARALEYLP